MKVLIIGATGLLATHLIPELSKKGIQLRLFSRSIKKEDYPSTIEVMSGNVFNESDLTKAIKGCNAVHISISKVDESRAAFKIAAAAQKEKVCLISYVSGSTVHEKNGWFRMINQKLEAEKMIKESGIPYLIFRPNWFFDSLELMVRGDKASVIGKQKHPIRFIAAEDFARMVCNAYVSSDIRNKTFFIHGKKQYSLPELLKSYCKELRPEVKKVSNVPVGMLKMIGIISRNKEIKEAAQMFAYFEKTPERGDPSEANKLLGSPLLDFEDWINRQKEKTTVN